MNETTPRDIPAEVRAEIESDPLVGIIAEDRRYFGPYHDETTDTVYDGLGRPVDVEAAVEQSRRWIRKTCRRHPRNHSPISTSPAPIPTPTKSTFPARQSR